MSDQSSEGDLDEGDIGEEEALCVEDPAQTQVGEVHVLPEDAEIHNTRIILQDVEITNAGDDRMIDSFQQHGRNKIRILRSCSAVNNFVDKLAVYGSASPIRKTPLCQEIRAPFNKTTMEMTSWKLGHDKIEVNSIPGSLIELAISIENKKYNSSYSSALPLISSTVPLLAFASAGKLLDNCHELPKHLAGLTLRSPRDLIKQDFEARRNLLQHLRTYLGTCTASTLLSSIKHMSICKKIPQANIVLKEVDSIASFIDKGISTTSLSLLAPALSKAVNIRKRIRSYTVQGLVPIQVRLALEEGPLIQENLFDKNAVGNASSLAQPCTSGPLQRASLPERQARPSYRYNPYHSNKQQGVNKRHQPFHNSFRQSNKTKQKPRPANKFIPNKKGPKPYDNKRNPARNTAVTRNAAREFTRGHQQKTRSTQ